MSPHKIASKESDAQEMNPNISCIGFAPCTYRIRDGKEEKFMFRIEQSFLFEAVREGDDG